MISLVQLMHKVVGHKLLHFTVHRAQQECQQAGLARLPPADLATLILQRRTSRDGPFNAKGEDKG